MVTTTFPTWAETAPDLIAVAAGRAPADLVIRGANVVSVHTREVLEGWDIAVKQGRFAYVGPNASHCIGEATEVIDAKGNVHTKVRERVMRGRR